MRAFNNYKFTRQLQAGHYNESIVLDWKFRGREHRAYLNCGLSDTIHVFREYDYLYVMSYNESLGYVSLQEIPLDPRNEWPEDYEITSIFFGDFQIEEFFGKDFLGKSNIYIAKKLNELI
jgi:hypothetical protein